MATNKLQVLIQAAVQGLGQVTQLAAQLKNAGTAASGSATPLQQAGLSFQGIGSSSGQAASQIASFISQSDAASKSFNALAGYANFAVKAFMAFAAVSSLKGAADVAARNETLGVTLDIIGKNAGYSTQEISKYETELQKLGITTGAARDSMIQMMQAGLSLAPAIEGAKSRVAEMARAAQDLAVVTGENSSQTLQRMITNIQQLDTVGLRFMGVVVNLDEATSKYAASLGKTAGALTQAERQQALYNAVMDKAAGLQGAYEASMDTVGKKLSSLSRYKEEAADAIGRSLLPAYGALVDSATEFLKYVGETSRAIADNGKVAEGLKSVMTTALDLGKTVASAITQVLSQIAPELEKTYDSISNAFADFDGGGFTEFLTQAADIAGTLGVTILQMVAEAAPELRLLADAALMLLTQVGDLLGAVASLGVAMLGASSDVDVLGGSISFVGLLIARLADVLRFVELGFKTLATGALVSFGSIANVIGDIVGLLNGDMGSALKKVGTAAFEMGMEQAGGMRVLADEINHGKSNLDKYIEALEKSKQAHKTEAAEAGAGVDLKKKAFADAEKLVLDYTRAVKENGLAGAAATTEYKKIESALKEMGAEGLLAGNQVALLTSKLDKAHGESDKTSKAFQDIGLNAQMFAKNTSEAGAKAVASFNTIAQSGKYTSDQLYRLFNETLNMETSVLGLEQFKQAADSAFKSGAMSATEYESALQLLNAKFTETFQTQLKAARTKEDFAQLTAEVNKLGAAGTISGAQVAQSLQSIADKAVGAKENMKALSSQAVDLAKATTSLSSADLNVTRASLDVTKARNNLIQAENNHRKKGTELSQAEVKAAQAELAVSEAQYKMAVARYEEEKASMNVLIEQQKLLNALRNQEQNPGPQADQQVQVQQQQVENAEKVHGATQRAAESQQQNVNETQKAALKAQALADNLRTAGDQSERVADGADKAASSWSNVKIQSDIPDYVDSLEKLDEYAKQMNEKYQRDNIGYIKTPGMGGYMKSIQDMFIKAKREQLEIQNAVDGAGGAMANQADSIRDAFDAASQAAEDAALGLKAVNNGMSQAGAAGNDVAEAYREIQRQASSAAKSATEAANSFSSSAGGIRQELLRAQGDELSASKMQYAQRQEDLKLQYEQLKVQIEIARVQATAAGLSTGALDQAMANATASYQQAMGDLGALAALDQKRIREAAAEQKKADAEKAAEAKKRAAEEVATQKRNLKDVTKQSNREAEQRASAEAKARERYSPEALLGTASERSTPAVTEAVQSIATQPTSPDFYKGLTEKVTKTSVIRFEMGGQKVTATVPQGEDDKLLKMLNTARRM